MKYAKRIVLFSLFAMNLVDQPAPEVKIEQGILSGKISADGSFFEYLGIPYATTNSSLRFKAPLPPQNWKGVYKATEEIYQCPQLLGPLVVGTEDCLKINVNVPAMAKRPLPVMVYIHGGAFKWGSNGKMIYAPDFLVKQNVIVVNFNYRLGPLGFLCLGTKELPGNAGLKDQVAALRWVKKNIAAFGGDPDNITLFGQSAGAASVSLLLSSPVTEGLFNKAIMQSGSSTASWSINREPVRIASLIAKHLGYNTDDPNEMYEIFYKMPLQKLLKAKPKKTMGMYFDTQMLNYPCVERVFEGDEAVITDFPYKSFEKNLKKDVTLMYGSTDKEGFFLLAGDSKEDLIERNSQYIFATDLEFPSEEVAINVSRMAKEYYFGDKKISFEVQDTIADLNTELYFEVHPIFETEALVKHERANVYNYYFTYNGGRNILSFVGSWLGFKMDVGATHADEILYLFKGRIWPFPIRNRDRKMIDLMTKMWTNFAKYSDPTPGADLPVKWKPSTKEATRFLYIDDHVKMGSYPNPDAYKLWNDIYLKYRKRNKPNDFKN